MTSETGPTLITDLIEAFRRSKTMFTAVKLGIFDLLNSGAQNPASVASKLRLNPDASERLLRACAGLGLLVREGETFRNTSLASRFLVTSSPDTLAGYILYSDRSLYELWGHLDDAVREGTNRWAQVFGSRDSLFAHYFRDDDAAASFLGGMHGFGQLSSAAVVQAFDLSRFTQLADLGGATGHLAIAACEAYPGLHATVFDLPTVEKFARVYIEHSVLSNRISFVAGDFFKQALPQADLYALGRILHDWDEAKIEKLLRKIFDALPGTGALLIAERLMNDDQSGPLSALMQDLNMLVCTDGRERTSDEYRSLLSAAGFRDIAFQKTGAAVDAILATKI